jgi:hypothetical protein
VQILNRNKNGNGYTPAFHLNKEQIEFANFIKAEFDIDLYANLYVDTLED